jgi:archaellum component FlaC
MDHKYLKKEAKRNLKHHEYNLIASGDNCEVWRCKRPGTSIYGFDICVSLFGIAIHGDIGNLSFNVGSYYGMPFLAGRDVGYYIHSKLDYIYYSKREVKPELIKDMISSEFFYQLRDLVHDPLELESDESEEDIGLGVKISEDSEHLQSMVDLAEKISSGEIGFSNFFAGQVKRIKDLLSAYRVMEICNFDITEDHTYRIMYENTNIDMSDGINITESDESIMLRLYFVNHAAKQIMKIKNYTHQDYRYMWT